MRIHWLFGAVFLSAVLATMHQVALTYFLYWRYTWLDTPMHALGGIAIGTFIIGILPIRRPITYLALCVIAFIGWEVFEYVAKLPQSPNYFFDTAKDLLMDTLGAVIVYFVARKTIWQSV